MSFTATEILILLLIAGISGALGQAISGVSRGGLFVSIALGFIGALLGAGLARAFNLPEPLAVQVGGAQFPVVWSIIGSAVFLVVLNLLRRPVRGEL